MKCHEAVEKLSAYMDDELDTVLSRQIAGHLDQCSECRREFEELSGVDILIKGLSHHRVSADFTGQILAKVREIEPKKEHSGLLHRAWTRLLKPAETLFDLLEPEPTPGTHTLEEFDDIPVSFIGYAYFKIINAKG